MSTNYKALTDGSRLALDPSTMNTLSAVVDPYSDKLLRSTGYPDGHSSISAIQRFYDRITVECPFNLMAGESWDFHIFTTPLHHMMGLSRATRSGNSIVYDPIGGNSTFGPITIKYTLYTAAGTPSGYPIYEGLCSAPVVSTPISLGNQYRTVSLGFELHNITAPIDREGSLTSYRTNVVDQYFSGYAYATGAAITTAVPHSTHIIATYPSDLGAASQYPNTRTWEAGEGIYAVALPDPINTYGQNMNTNFSIFGIDASGSCRVRPIGANTNSTQVTFSPLANVGVISSRFARNQTFVLDYRHNLECIPDPADTQMVSFATTAPLRDEVFLKLYTKMFNSIPPAVPVDFNSAGEWFRRIVSLAKTVLPQVLPYLPPQLKAIAGPVRVGLDVADAIMKSKKQKQKPENTTQLVALSQAKGGRMLPARRQ